MIRKLVKDNQRFIKHNLFSYFVIFFNLFASLYAVRENINILQKDLYGVWILVLSTTGILGIFHFGFSSVTIFKFTDYKNNNRLPAFFASNLFIIIIQLIITILVFILLHKCSHFLISEVQFIEVFNSLLVLALPGALFTSVSAYLEAILYYNLKYIYHRNLLEMLRLGIMNLLFVIGLYLYDDIRVMAVIYSCVSLVAFLYTLNKFKSKEKITIDIHSFNRKYLLDNIHDSISFWVLGISSFIIAQTDVFFISTLTNEVGLVTMYSQSFRIQDIALKLIKKITEIKGPKILLLFNSGKHDAVVDIYNKLLLINLALSVGAFLFITFTGKFLLEYWLNKAIVFDQTLITTLSLICITGSIHWVLWNFCNLSGQQKKVKNIVVFEIIANLMLSYFFMKTWGVIGLGIASLVSNSITIVYTYTLFLQYKNRVLD